MKPEVSRQILETNSNIKLHENPSSGCSSRVIPCWDGETEGRTHRHDSANIRVLLPIKILNTSKQYMLCIRTLGFFKRDMLPAEGTAERAMCCLNHFRSTRQRNHNAILKSSHFQNYTVTDTSTISNECTLEI
jgi:hypothetical protein